MLFVSLTILKKKSLGLYQIIKRAPSISRKSVTCCNISGIMSWCIDEICLSFYAVIRNHAIKGGLDLVKTEPLIKSASIPSEPKMHA